MQSTRCHLRPLVAIALAAACSGGDSGNPNDPGNSSTSWEVTAPTAAEEAVIDSTTEAIKALSEEASSLTDAGDTSVELKAEEEVTSEIEAQGEGVLVEESIQQS